ncbi:extensin family protein [Pikeienuella piscinae]|uniref:Extensin family protein n=1 Tax=Pikeienuella piscinae TaxID=2748098 RepID=A0A7L5BX70_9RHOB|nr:extensin family protein [Pikeienuella piscinae]QIE54846.1 extensin family protein [Pikeienuella piscinae]
MSGWTRICLAAFLMVGCQTLGEDESEPLEAASAAPATAPTPSPRGVAPKVKPASQRILSASLGPVGPVCGDPRVIGAKIPSISGAHPGCAIEAPVSLVEVAGVALTGKAEVNCRTAVALADWMEKSARPAARKAFSVQLTAVKPAASYACRGRNGRKGAKLSEHAKGNAIDISEFTFASGQVVEVESGWRRKGAQRKYLRSVWAGACGPFGTVLGPEADRYHRNHFHFDVARYRMGNYCR